ncbi:MAG: site-specific integrase [Actinobacteria bacterium]|nr:site-specific integrase [Actinomycetota bacterium]
MRGSVFKRCPCGTRGTPGRLACKKPHGAWWWRADAEPDPTTGARRQEHGSGYPSRTEAQSALITYFERQRTGTWVDDQKLTVEVWLTVWLAECRERLELATVNGYASHIRSHLIPQLGSIRLRDLRRQHVEAMLQTIATAPLPERTGRGGRTVERRSARTLDAVRRTLRSALSTAQRRGLVVANVAEGRMDSIPTIGRAAASWWQPDEVAAFLTAVDGDPLFALYEVAAFAGLRRGELLGLRWEDVDLDRAAAGLHVRQSLSGVAGAHDCVVCGGSHRGRRIKPPKSEAGARWVPLVGDTVTALPAHRDAQAAERARWGEAYVDHGLIFALDNGDPLRPDRVTKDFEDQAAAAGLPKIKLHEMRHGACSLLLAAGVPVETVAMILGHASPAVTRAVYAHVLRGPAREGMQAAVGLVRGDRRAHSVHSNDASDSQADRTTG